MPQATQKNSNKKIIWISVAVVVVVALAVWAFNANREPVEGPAGSAATTTGQPSTDTPGGTTSPAPSSDIPVVTPAPVVSDSSLAMPSPQDAGLQVVVSNISVSVPTWVVVYESKNGQPGNALGAGLFIAGRNSGTIELLRATLAGQTYIAAEAKDDGDHMFSLKNDTPVRDAQGNPMWVQFQTR